jgi:hypothetical protein
MISSSENAYNQALNMSISIKTGLFGVVLRNPCKLSDRSGCLAQVGVQYVSYLELTEKLEHLQGRPEELPSVLHISK